MISHSSKRPRLLFCYGVAGVLCSAATLLWGETGKMLVQVQDTQGKPVAGIEIGIKGIGGSKLTGSDGKVQLPLGKDTQENDWVLLQVVHSPPRKNFTMISPWDSRAQVPSFKEKAENFVQVVVIQQGDGAALANSKVPRAFAQKINAADTSKIAEERSGTQDPKANLNAIAKQYGLAPDDVDHAIRAWGAKASDPYEVGVAALYQGDHVKATSQLQDSLRTREEKLSTHPKTTATDREAVADAAFSLGSSLFRQGRYLEASQA